MRPLPVPKHKASGRSRGHKPAASRRRRKRPAVPGRGRRKTKRGQGSGGERQPGASGAGCGPSRQGMPGPVRPSPGGASIRIAAVTGGGARPGRRARRGAALQHCRSPLLPRSLLRPPPPLGSGGPARGTHRPRRAPLPPARGIHRRRARLPGGATSERLLRSGSAAAGEGCAPTGGVLWLVSSWRSPTPRGWRDRPAPSGHSLSCPPVPAPPLLSRGSSRKPPPVLLPPSPSVWPCRQPRRGAWPRVGQPRSSRVPARALGLVPRVAGTATESGQGCRVLCRAARPQDRPSPMAPCPRPSGYLRCPRGGRKAVTSPASPVHREAKPGTALRHPPLGDSGPGRGASPPVTGSCRDSGCRDPRVLRARGAKGSEAVPVEGAGGGRASQDRLRCQVQSAGGGRERGHGSRGLPPRHNGGPFPRLPLCLCFGKTPAR